MVDIVDLFGGGGGGSGGRATTLFFHSSTTYTPQVDQSVIIHVFGGGGQGGIASGKYSTTGGGAGGYARKALLLSAGTMYTLTAGAGGGYSYLATTGALDGGDGGTSSFSGADIDTITANGGGGGEAVANSVEANGGAGGTATGGDANYTGGRGGNIAADTSGFAVQRATGGGAVNLFGLGPFNGGDLTGTDLSSIHQYQATGGAGVASHGVSSSSNGIVRTLGGSSYPAGLSSRDVVATRDALELFYDTAPILGITKWGYSGPTFEYLTNALAPYCLGTGAGGGATTVTNAGGYVVCRGGGFAGAGGLVGSGANCSQTNTGIRFFGGGNAGMSCGSGAAQAFGAQSGGFIMEILG